MQFELRVRRRQITDKQASARCACRLVTAAVTVTGTMRRRRSTHCARLVVVRSDNYFFLRLLWGLCFRAGARPIKDFFRRRHKTPKIFPPLNPHNVKKQTHGALSVVV
jgi:hypothetical protein